MKQSRYLFSVLAVAASVLSATPVTFSGAGTGSLSSLAASATFDVSGSNLVITLTNTSSVMTTQPAQLLTALYFDYLGTNPALTPVSAILPGGEYVACNNPAVCPYYPAGGNVGGEWAFGRQAVTPGIPREFGVSSTGMGLFGSANRFGTVNLAGPVSVGGMQYGIATQNYNPLDPSVNGGNGGLRTEHVIVNSVVFTLGGFSGSLDNIGNVLFQYGTALSEPQIPGLERSGQVPEPATMGMLAAGLVGFALYWRRR